MIALPCIYFYVIRFISFRVLVVICRCAKILIFFVLSCFVISMTSDADADAEQELCQSPPRLKRRNSMKKKSRNTMKRSQLKASAERKDESSGKLRARTRITLMVASEEPVAAKMARQAANPEVRRSQSQLLLLPGYFSEPKSIRRSRSNTLKNIFMRSESPTDSDANSSTRNSKDVLALAQRLHDDPLEKEVTVAVVPEMTVNILVTSQVRADGY